MTISAAVVGFFSGVSQRADFTWSDMVCQCTGTSQILHHRSLPLTQNCSFPNSVTYRAGITLMMVCCIFYFVSRRACSGLQSSL